MVEVYRLEIKQRETYHAIESMEAPVVDGVRMCLNGCGKPVPEGNRKYCSRECANEFFAKHNQTGLRQFVFEREHGKCQGCGYQYPMFDKPFPAKPLMPTFSIPRPNETDFQGYSKCSLDRITHFENQLIVVDQNLFCSKCEAPIPKGSEAYCYFPKRKENETYCHSDHCPYVPAEDLSWRDRWCRDKKTRLCPNAHCLTVHCVECGRKELHEIEKDWNRTHRKALAAFKAAYKQWDAAYTQWAKEVLPKFRERERLYFEACKQWNTERDAWEKTVEFRDFVADHIVPIALGGPEFDPKNVQLLCSGCNKKKTAKDAADIAQRRREIKKLNGYAPLTGFT